MQGRHDAHARQHEATRPGRDAGQTGPRAAPGGDERATDPLPFADRLRDEIGGEAFDRYVGRVARLDLSDHELRVTVPSRFAADLIRQRFGEAIRRVITASETGREIAVHFEVCPPAEADDAGARHSEAAPLERPARARAASRPRGEADHRTFASFVVGRCNRLAFEAARRLAEEPSSGVTCPLFVYGPCGVGKSHLLAAVAARFAEVFPGSRVRLVSAEAFTGEYIKAVKSDRVEAFHASYRRTDLLCIDDVHYLSKKAGTQAELLHTFDRLNLSGARVVLASDNHPRHIKAFSDALVSRFVSGSLTRLDAPDGATRRRLLAFYAERAGLRIAEPAMDMLAGIDSEEQADRPTVRDLIGLVNRAVAYVRLVDPCGGGEVDASVAAAVLRTGQGDDDSARPSRPVPMESILDAVCAALEVTRADLAGRGRQRAVVLARSLVARLARRLTRRSYPEIAQAIGRSNHSTVITAHRRIDEQIARGERVDAGLHCDGLTIEALADRIERPLRGGR